MAEDKIIIEYQAKIDKLESDLKALEESLKAVEAAAKKGGKATEESFKKQDGIINKLRSNIQKLTEARDKSNNPRLLDLYNKKLDEANTKLKRLTTTTEEYGKKSKEVTSEQIKQISLLERGFNNVRTAVIGAFAIEAVINFGEKIIETGVKFDSLERAITFASGSSIEAQRNFAFLDRISNELGLDLLTTTEAFKGFSAAAVRSGYDGDQTRKIFSQVSTAVTAMGLSAQDAQGVFLALTQIMSKGKVQAEELRGQIGERLPGAFEIAAKSLGVTTAQLNEMLEKGEVLSKDFLPAFAEELEKTFEGALPDAADSAQANINRLTNSFNKLYKTLFEGNEGLFSGATKGLTRFIEDTNGLLENKSSDEIIQENFEAVIEQYKKQYSELSYLERTLEAQRLSDRIAADKKVAAAVKDRAKEFALAESLQQKKAIVDEYNARQAAAIAIAQLNASEDAKEEQRLKDLADTQEKLKEEQAKEDKKKAEKAAKEREKQFRIELEQFKDKVAKEENEVKQQYLNGTIAKEEYQKKLDDIEIKGLEGQKKIYERYAKDIADLDQQILDIKISNKEEEEKKAKEAYEKLLKEDYEYYQNLSKLQKTRREEWEDDAKFYEKLSKDMRDKDEKEEKEHRAKVKKIVFEATEELASIARTFQDARTDKKLSDIDAEAAAADQQTDKEIQRLDKLKKSELISETQYEARREQLLKQQKQREAEFKKRQFEVEKEAKIKEIAMETALGIAKAVAASPETFGLPFSAFVAGQGLAQAAIIRKQQAPKFLKDGEILIKGPGNETSDSIPAMLSRNESVIRAKQSIKHADALHAINNDEFDNYINKDYIKPMLAKQRAEVEREKKEFQQSLMKVVADSVDMSHLERLTAKNKNVNISNIYDLSNAIFRITVSDMFYKRNG